MKITATVKLGNTSYAFYIDEAKEMDALHKAAVLGNPPNYCNECKNQESFRLDSNKDKDGNVYVNVVCRKCGAKAKLGLYKSGGYFWHKFEKYVKQDDQNQGSSQQPNEPLPPTDEDDLPF